ncbi:hypothetical protein CEXT_48401 [Caerostris extrusa]|uniref:Uncharacterized protein n=1 Tax=Caerostris extrusa TaxID=172846 RepID=A0AAV4N438_CAEEX|nr:hypothetical protein CEXT_48401 [Caerostris extrusa]
MTQNKLLKKVRLLCAESTKKSNPPITLYVLSRRRHALNGQNSIIIICVFDSAECKQVSIASSRHFLCSDSRNRLARSSPPHVIAADLIKRHTERNNSLRSPSSGRSAAAKYTETGSCWAKVVPPGRTVNTKQTTQVARGGGRREGVGVVAQKNLLPRRVWSLFAAIIETLGHPLPVGALFFNPLSLLHRALFNYFAPKRRLLHPLPPLEEGAWFDIFFVIDQLLTVQ